MIDLDTRVDLVVAAHVIGRTIGGATVNDEIEQCFLVGELPPLSVAVDHLQRILDIARRHMQSRRPRRGKRTNTTTPVAIR